MPPIDLRLTVARYTLGLAHSQELSQAADAALNQVYTDSLCQLATTGDLVLPEAGRLFEKALRELGLSLPSREEAIQALLIHSIGAVAEGAVAPRAGLESLKRDLYYPIIQEEPVTRYVGDSRGIEHLLRCYYSYDDLAARPTEISVAGKYGSEAVAELDRQAVELAGKWLRERSGLRMDASWLTWNSGTVSRLARVMEEQGNRDWPVLADALEEAGCHDPNILGHLRQPGLVHVQGCWVAHLILGRR
jgi:hypothetical protein